MDTTLGLITLEGDGHSFIAENTCRKEGVLTPMPMYLMDSTDTEVFDYGGVLKTLNITGIYIGADKAAVKDFIDTCEALIQGCQDVEHGYPVTFQDEFRGTIKVKLLDFESTKTQGEPLIARWTFKLVQAKEGV